MKKTIIFAILLSFSIISSGCELNSDDTENSPAITTGSTIVKDKNGVTIGTLLTAEMNELSVINDSGYFFRLHWDGSIKVNKEPFPFFFTEPSCEGIRYLATVIDPILYGKFLLLVDGSIFRAKNINEDGTSLYSSLVGYLSIKQNNGTCTDSSNVLSGIELEEVDRSSVGIPDIITPPITIE